MISESFKQEVLSRVDIVDVIDARVPLKKAGANFSACCPFHTEKSPSFTVSPSKQFYHCFGCGAHGNAISFLMEYGGLGYVDALRDLAELVGMQLPAYEGPTKASAVEQGPDLGAFMERAQAFYKDNLKRAPRAIEYLKARGLTGQVAARFGIGYAPPGWQNLQAVFEKYDDKALIDAGLVIQNEEGRRYDRFRDRIMFPILNQRGAVIGFGGRVLDKAQTPKYMNSPETPLFEKGRELYGLVQAREGIRTQGRVFVVEGYMDVVALAQYGVSNAVATLGTATTPTHITKLLRQTSEIVFCFDGDNAGRKAAWHALEIALGVIPDGKLARFLFLPADDDPDSYVRAHGAEVFTELANEAPTLSQYLIRELEQRHGTSTAEGRSTLVSDARPLVTKMTAPALQVQLLREIAVAAHMTVEELAQLYGLRVASRPAGKWERTASRFREPLPRTASQNRVRLAAAGRLERELLHAILAHPPLAAEIAIEFIDGEAPVAQAARALIEAVAALGARLGDEAAVTGAMIIEQLRDSPHEGVIREAQSDLLGLNLTEEAARANLRGVLAQLEFNQLETHKQLMEKGDMAAMGVEDKNRYLALISRLAALREVRRFSDAGDPRVVQS